MVQSQQRRTRLSSLAARAGLEPRAYLLDLLAKHPSQTAAAAAVDVDRVTLWRWLTLYGIEREEVTIRK